MRLRYHLLCIILCLLFFNGKSLAQNQIKGSFTGPITIEEVILEKYGLQPQIIQTSRVLNNSFSINIPHDIAKGVYKLSYKSGQSSSGFDLIINNKENIVFTLPLSSSQFINPEFKAYTLNKIWYNQQAHFQKLNQKIATLKQAWVLYPDQSDAIVAELEKSLINLVNQQSIDLQNLSITHPYIAFLIKNKQLPEGFNPQIHPEEQESYSINQFWTNINTNNVDLINTPFLNTHIYNYINYHIQKSKNATTQNRNTILTSCVDKILDHFSNPETRKYTVNYLTQGFKQLGNEFVLQYLDETYAEIEQCDNPNDLNLRLEGYKKLKPGNQAPPILVSNKNIIEQETGQETILVFWASWCPHCMEEIPQLNNWVKDKSINIVAVSLDYEESHFNKAKMNLTEMYHYCDFKKWESKPVKDYFIKGTPTYFHLDKNNKIKQKYTSFDAIKAGLINH